MKVSDSFQLDFFLFSLINLRMSSYFYLLFFYFYFNCVEGRCACAPLPGRTCGATPDNPNEAWCLEGATPVARCVSHEAQCGGCPHLCLELEIHLITLQVPVLKIVRVQAVHKQV